MSVDAFLASTLKKKVLSVKLWGFPLNYISMKLH